MNSLFSVKISRQWLFFLLVILLASLTFRLVYLDQKVYWHDEVYTQIRSAGYKSTEIYEEFFQGRFVSPEEFARLQRLKPDSSALDTIDSLAKEDPQHPPLYFLLSRYWEKLFGFSLVSSRILPIVISLLSLPAIYFLTIELWNSRITALLAVVFLALSPVEILFSQIARQYSTLTLLTLLAQLFFLRSIRRSTPINWFFYTLFNTLGLYTHLFFVLNIVAQFIFTVWHDFIRRDPIQKIGKPFASSLAITVLLYSPWLMVFTRNSEQALATTDWSKVDSIDWVYFGKLWTLSFSCLFNDLFFGFDSILTYLVRSVYLFLIVFAFYTVYKTSDRMNFWFLSIAAFVPFLILASLDLVFLTQRSLVTRYLVTCFPAIYITIAYLFANKLSRGKTRWKLIFALGITASLLSNYQNALSLTSWTKVPSYHNGEIVKKINAAPRAIVMSDRGDDWTNLGDSLSINYFVRPDVRYFFTGTPPDLERARAVIQDPGASIFLFRPSRALVSAFRKLNIPIEKIYPDGRLWKVIR